MAQHLWLWQPPVNIKAEPEVINALKTEWSEVISDFGGAATRVANDFFMAGWNLYKESGVAGVRSALGSNSSITSRYYAQVERKTYLAQLKFIYENEFECNDAEFTDAMLKDNVIQADINVIIRGRYGKRTGNTGDWTLDRIPLMERWLDSGILSDGLTHSTAECKENATEQGAIRDDADWSTLRNLISDRGYTSGVRGYWRRPL